MKTNNPGQDRKFDQFVINKNRNCQIVHVPVSADQREREAISYVKYTSLAFKKLVEQEVGFGTIVNDRTKN